MLHTLQTTHSESIKDRLRGGTIQRLVFAVFAFVLLLASPAAAYEITGGTPEQREYVRDVIEASKLDVEAVDEAKDLEVLLVDEWSPYWMLQTNGGLRLAYGVAYWDGRIVIDSDLGEAWLGETTAHEVSHQIWFMLPRAAWIEWQERVGGGDSDDWYRSPAENYAETARVHAWNDAWYVTENPRSDLRTLTHDEFWEFQESWNADVPETTTTTTNPPTTTTTEPPRGNPFLDVKRADDEELWEAAWFAKNEGLLRGYEDGKLRPYQPLLRRHVTLVAGRASLDVFKWRDDYSPALRAEVRDTFESFTWKEERWDEPLLRSQLLRLLYRASQK